MSRASRQSIILNIISTKDIETQDDLVLELKRAGFDITQATISRDIKELGLVKTLTADNKYKYVTKQKIDVGQLSLKLKNVVREAVLSVTTAQNLVVVKTIEDGAAAVSNALEQLPLQNCIGLLADRSTVLAICANYVDAADVENQIKQLL